MSYLPVAADPYAASRHALDLPRGDYSPLMAGYGNDDRWDSSALRQLFAMLVRRRKVALATLGTVLVATLVFLLLAPPIYESVATLQVHTASAAPASDAESRDLPVLADMSGATESRSLETQLAILHSLPVRQGAIAQLSPGAKSAAESYGDTNIEAVGDTDLIAITSRTHDPNASAALSNAYCKEYIQLSRAKNRGQLQEATNYVGRQLNSASAKLDQARNALRVYKQQNGTFDLPAESQNLLTEVGQIEGEWRQTRADKASQIAELSKLRSVAASMPTTQVMPQQIVRRPAVEAMKAQLAKLELDRMAALQEYQPTRPEVQSIDGQIAAIKQQLKREAQTEIGSWSNEVNPVRQNVSQDIAKLQGQIWASESRGTALKNAAQAARAQLAKLPGREQRMGQLTTDLAAQQQAYQMLNEKFQTLRMSQEARVANASILFPAEPGLRVGASRARSFAFALLLGIALAVALAALLDWFDDGIYSERDANIVSHLPVLAQVPYIADETHQVLMPSGFFQSVPSNPALLESFRMARTRLALSSIQKPIKAVLITSSLPHEGKSATAVNLAIAAAESGEKVILIDGDLRCPTLHQLLKVPDAEGLTDVIQGNVSPVEVLRQTEVPNLRVLTSGSPVANAFGLLNTPAMRTCLKQLMEQADFIVIDSPPALSLADAQILSTMADATLLVISSQEVSRPDIVRTRELLASTGNRPHGVILTKVAPTITEIYGQNEANASPKTLERRLAQ